MGALKSLVSSCYVNDRLVVAESWHRSPVDLSSNPPALHESVDGWPGAQSDQRNQIGSIHVRI